MYKTTIDNLLAYARYTNKTRWESDLGCIYTAGNWTKDYWNWHKQTLVSSNTHKFNSIFTIEHILRHIRK